MCGIVGYVGSKNVVPVVIEGLRCLEYRGYDNAGIAVVNLQMLLRLIAEDKAPSYDWRISNEFRAGRKESVES